MISSNFPRRFNPALLLFLLLSIFIFSGTAQAQDSGDKINLVGVLDVIHGDPPPGSNLPHMHQAYLTEDDGIRSYRVQGDQATLEEFSGRRVSIVGTFDADGGGSSGSPSLSVSAIIPLDTRVGMADGGGQATGSQPWVNILCKYSDIATEPQPVSYFNGLMGGSYPQMNHYWTTTSYGQMNINGSTTTSQWFTLPQPKSYYVVNGDWDLDQFFNDCTALADASINFNNYIGVNLMVNDTSGCCAWGGSKFTTLDGTTRNIKTTWMPPWAFNSLGVMGHEMGHGFGLPHSSGPYAAVYDSDWDVMSSQGVCRAEHNNATYGCVPVSTIAKHIDQLGWMAANRKITVNVGDDTQTITLNAVTTGQGTTDYLLAIIPINGSATNYYTVEARTFAGTNGNVYDQNVPFEGVIMHRRGNSSEGMKMLVVDPTNDNNPNDAGVVLVPGEAYNDNTNNIIVEVISRNGSNYSVRIRNQPDVVLTCHTLTLSKTGTGNGTIPTASPTNSNGCAAGQYKVGTNITLTAAAAQGSAVGSWTGTTNNASTSNSNTVTMPDNNHSASVEYVASLANDDFDFATVIGALPYGNNINTASATTANDDPSACALRDKSVWYRYTPVGSGEVTLSTVGSLFDTVLAVYTGSRGSLSSVICNDDANGTVQSQVTFNVAAGTTYHIMVAGWSGASGALSFSASGNVTQSCYALTRSHTGNGADPVANPTNSNGCSAGQYVFGENISLTAAPDSGHRVASWTGTSNNSSTSTSNSLSMPASNTSVSVIYETIPTCYTLTLSHTGNGTDPVASPTNSNGCPTGQFNAGQLVYLTANPDGGYSVSGWTGTSNNSSTSTTNSLIMPASATSASVSYELAPELNLISPSGTINTPYGNPTYEWTDVGSSGYHVYVGKRTTGLSQIFYLTNYAADCDGVICSLEATILNENYRLSNGNYEVWLRGMEGSTGVTPWRGPFTFTLAAPAPGIPAITEVTNTTSTTPTFNWTLEGAAVNASWFQLQVYNVNYAGDVTTLVLSQWKKRGDTCGTVDGNICSLLSPQALPTAMEYAVKIRAWGPGGFSTGGPLNDGWSSYTHFNIGGEPAELAANLNANPRQGRPRISWNDDPNTLRIQIWMGPNPAGAFNQTFDRAGWNGAGSQTFSCAGGTCQVDPNINWTAGTYNVWVRTWGLGGWSSRGTDAPSAPSWVQEPGGFTLPNVLPSACCNGQTYVDYSVGYEDFAWLPFFNATWYQLQALDSSDAVIYTKWVMAYTSTYGTGEACGSAAAQLCYYQPDVPLDSLEVVTVRMRAWGPGGFSDFVYGGAVAITEGASAAARPNGQ